MKTRKCTITDTLKDNEVRCWTCSKCGKIIYFAKDLVKCECGGVGFHRSATQVPCKDCLKDGKDCSICWFKNFKDK